LQPSSPLFIDRPVTVPATSQRSRKWGTSGCGFWWDRWISATS
jgi:hypothetical protein